MGSATTTKCIPSTPLNGTSGVISTPRAPPSHIASRGVEDNVANFEDMGKLLHLRELSLENSSVHVISSTRKSKQAVRRASRASIVSTHLHGGGPGDGDGVFNPAYDTPALQSTTQTLSQGATGGTHSDKHTYID